MTGQLFRIISRILAVLLIIISIFLFWLTYEAASETENWKAFDFDFTHKEGVISSYGSLLASILSFVAILLVLLDLFYQRRLKAIENEEYETAKMEEYRDSLNIILLFLEELLKDILGQNSSAMDYSQKEAKNPTEMNKMSFLPNTYPKLILDVDRIKFYDAMHHYQPGNDWRKLYVDLYKITDFYDKSFEELLQKHQNHLDKKFKHARELATVLDEFIDINSDIRNDIINECKVAGTRSTDNPYFRLLQFIKDKSVEIISKRTNPETRTIENYVNPTSFTIWNDELLQVAFDEILLLWNTHGNDPHNLKILLNKAQSFIREYLRLIQDSQDYSTHIENHFTSYFSEKAEYVKQLREIIEQIKLALTN